MALAIAALHRYHYCSIDITSAFVYAPLPKNSTLFAEIPPGHPRFADRSTHVLRVERNSHGLKEAPSIWWTI